MCPTDNSNYATTSSSRISSNLRSAFEVLDVDHDGKISRDDLESFYGGFVGGADDEDVIGSMISLADSNKDGYVEYHEFEKVLEGNSNHVNGDDESIFRNGGIRLSSSSSSSSNIMEEVFMVMDKDADGKVGVADLQSYLTSAGLAASDDDVKAMIKFAGGDVHENGGVTYQGFLKILGCA